MMPQLPESLIDHGMYDHELADLWHQLVVELLDENYTGRSHGNRRTFDAGCKGPLCKKAVREHGRRRQASQPSEKYKYIDMILGYWHPQAVMQIQAIQKRLVGELTGVEEML